MYYDMRLEPRSVEPDTIVASWQFTCRPFGNLFSLGVAIGELESRGHRYSLFVGIGVGSGIRILEGGKGSGPVLGGNTEFRYEGTARLRTVHVSYNLRGDDSKGQKNSKGDVCASIGTKSQEKRSFFFLVIYSNSWSYGLRYRRP
ncbi:hypothetical protein F4776DRAFT_274225 [Hypoxylon sp. NC0597]|nr:hypothetical protein F4776DRAFT_274225 [Hypoxylon sp. NC0597]